MREAIVLRAMRSAREYQVGARAKNGLVRSSADRLGVRACNKY
jgi:hypothetical protein